MKIPVDTCNTVIFDLGNVLVHYDAHHCLDQYDFDKKTKIRINQAVFQSSAWVEGDRGTYGPETWCDAFVANAPQLEQEIRLVYEGLCECILPADYTEDLIRWFREKGYRIYFLSTIPKGFMKRQKTDFILSNPFMEEFFPGKKNVSNRMPGYTGFF